jgi:hypothetical protein
MLRRLMIAGVAAVACTVAFAAQTVTNKAVGFRVSFPDGWTVIQDKDDPGAIVGVLTGVEGDPLCVVAGEKKPRTPGQTQAQINAEMREPLSKADVLGSLIPDFKNPSVESTVSRLHRSGLQMHEAVVAYTDKITGGPMMMKMSTMRAVDASYGIICGTDRPVFATHAAAFGSIVESLTPAGGAVADVNLPPETLAHTVATHEPGEETREAISAATQKFARARNAAGTGAAQP